MTKKEKVLTILDRLYKIWPQPKSALENIAKIQKSSPTFVPKVNSLTVDQLTPTAYHIQPASP